MYLDSPVRRQIWLRVARRDLFFIDSRQAVRFVIVRVRVYVASREDVMAVSKVLGETFSDPRPTNTTIICGFAMEEMKVELEVTALKQKPA